MKKDENIALEALGERVAAILAEDEARERRLREDYYDPVSGHGSHGERREVLSPVPGEGRVRVPVTMVEDEGYGAACGDSIVWRRLRCRHDFEYWAVSCVKIRDKTDGREVAFRLNRPQRRVLGVLEGDRLEGSLIRLIMLKARQWGGSTLIQMYMAWIQSCHRRNWNSLICAHVKDTAGVIRGMYASMLESYPEELWEGDDGGRPQFKPFERSQNIRQISGRGCRVTIGSSENQEAVRGADYAMAHLSETAFWQATPRRTPESFIRAVCGAIALQPLTLVAIESTANGVGNYFHAEWLRSKSGLSDKHAVFVPWHEIEIYRLEPPDKVVTARHVLEDEYAGMLWDKGCTLAQIHWYRRKAGEYPCRELMQAEFPTTDTEAFLNTGRGVFSVAAVERLRAGCCPARETGAVTAGGMFVADERGGLQVWSHPDRSRRYVAGVDVGGRSVSADWSVIAVLAVGEPSRGLPPEIVAQWRGHIDHDLLALEAERIATYYNRALLVVESNTLESEVYGGEGGGGDGNMFVLARLADRYSNLYRRRVFDSVKGSMTMRYGFHTNRATKPMLVAQLVEAVRDGLYVERDQRACDEYVTYEQHPNGSYAAKPGCHDDVLMTRGMMLLVASTELDIRGGGGGVSLAGWKPRSSYI